MSNKILNLIFKATDKASPTLDKLQGASGQSGVGGLTDSLKKMINPATLAMGAVAGLGTAVAAAFADYQEYVGDVSDLNAMINGTMTETSMLIRMMEDYDVTQDTMLAAMRMLASQGYDPSIESLIEIRDLLDACETNSERLALAQQLLGEQGIKQLLPMFESLGGELDSYVENFDEGLIVTEEMRDRQIELEKATADLDAAWTKMKLSVFGSAAETFGPMVVGWADVLSGQKSYFEAMDDVLSGKVWKTFYSEIDVTTRSIQDLTGAHEEWLLELKRLQPEIEGATTDTGKLKEAQDNLRTAIEKGTPAEATYWAGIIQTLEDRIAELDRLYNLYVNIPYAPGAIGGKGHEPYVPSPGGGDGWTGPRINGWPVYPWSDAADKEYYRTHPYSFATGGSFEVGGSGGPDSQRVGIDVTPGEIVNVSQEDTMRELLLVMKRLPTTIADALERKL